MRNGKWLHTHSRALAKCTLTPQPNSISVECDEFLFFFSFFSDCNRLLSELTRTQQLHGVRWIAREIVRNGSRKCVPTATTRGTIGCYGKWKDTAEKSGRFATAAQRKVSVFDIIEIWITKCANKQSEWMTNWAIVRDDERNFSFDNLTKESREKIQIVSFVWSDGAMLVHH